MNLNLNQPQPAFNAERNYNYGIMALTFAQFNDHWSRVTIKDILGDIIVIDGDYSHDLKNPQQNQYLRDKQIFITDVPVDVAMKSIAMKYAITTDQLRHMCVYYSVGDIDYIDNNIYLVTFRHGHRSHRTQETRSIIYKAKDGQGDLVNDVRKYLEDQIAVTRESITKAHRSYLKAINSPDTIVQENAIITGIDSFENGNQYMGIQYEFFNGVKVEEWVEVTHSEGMSVVRRVTRGSSNYVFTNETEFYLYLSTFM